MKAERPAFWTAAVLAVWAPAIAALCLTLWQMPFPVTEAVAIFEDIANQPFTRFLTPDTAYYRPLFHMTISAIWHNAGSLEAQLAWIKVLHLVPIVVLVIALVGHVRPRTRLEAVAAALAVAVLVGSPGFRDNLELPLSYTIVGMPLALLAWILMNREPRWWHQPAIILLTLAAVGFKEQGLVLVPLVLAAWWIGAPGGSRWTAAALALAAGAYVVWRLIWRESESLPMFEQAVGLGFGEMEPPEALARFGDFPYFIYAYSAASTVDNVLFGEPTRGTFSIIRTFVYSRPEPWQLVQLASSVMLTALIAWWGVHTWRKTVREGWTAEARSGVALVVVLLACGALSFNYSRDRLGGMAVPFYAIAAFHAIRFAAARALTAPPPRSAVIAALLLAVGAGWPLRAVGTIERSRLTSVRNQMEWLVLLPARRVEFAERPTYLRIMDSMVEQGTAPGAPRPTRYPSLIRRFIAELPPEPAAPPTAYTLGDAIAAGDVRQAFEFVRAGQDPDDLIAVRDDRLTGREFVFVSPLVWAAATGSTQAAQMLLGFGARMERPADRRSACVADALGHGDTARVLREAGAEAECAPFEAGDAPLAQFLRGVQ